MKRTATLLLAATVCMLANALSVRLDAPGTLRDAVADAESTTQLALSGSIDASDFSFIADGMPALEQLDLSGATIVAYEGEALQGIRRFPAATLPQLLLAGSRISSVTLPDGLAAIGECALAGTPLTAIVVPASVRTVGPGAFAGCTQLLPADAGAATLGEGAFSGCTALSTVTLPAGAAVPARCFAGDAALAAVNAPGIASIGERAFAGCTALTALDFGTELKEIGAHAFAGSGIAKADLAACTGLASIGSGAFAGCLALEELTLPENADIADAHALAMGDTHLTAITLPAGSVPAYAFTGAAAVDAAAVLKGATEVGEYALKGATATHRVTLAATLEYLGDHAMEGMTGLERIYATELTAVPALGSDVWKGVEQPAVRLMPADDMIDAFRNADQWKEFDVRSVSSTGTIINEATGRLRATFSDGLLLVECTIAGVEGITVADTEGRVLATLVPDSDGRAALDTSHWTTRIYLLATSGSARANLKIARNF